MIENIASCDETWWVNVLRLICVWQYDSLPSKKEGILLLSALLMGVYVHSHTYCS
jgi:hypothetical protein